MRIRARITEQLAKGGWDKTSQTFEYIKLSYEEFMIWVNSGEYTYGEPGLDLDHIIPVSVARTEKEMRALNEWPNWRLIPASINRAKKDKIPARNLLNEYMTTEMLAIWEREVEIHGEEWDI